MGSAILRVNVNNANVETQTFDVQETSISELLDAVKSAVARYNGPMVLRASLDVEHGDHFSYMSVVFERGKLN